MLVERIISRQNPLIKRFRRVRAGNERHLVLIEGVRLIEDALGAGAHFESIAYTSALESSERGIALMDSLQQVPCRGAHVSKQVMDHITDTESPQGIAAIVARPQYEIADTLSASPQLLVICDRLQDPGNLGAIIRTAEAAGATGLITTRHTVDPFNHKALRASMGAALRIPIITDARRSEIRRACAERKVKIVASQPRPPRQDRVIKDAAQTETVLEYTEIDMTGPFALILGQEASGVSGDTAALADSFTYIPMAEGVESLNVAAAAAILLFEAARQRQFQFR